MDAGIVLFVIALCSIDYSFLSFGRVEWYFFFVSCVFSAAKKKSMGLATESSREIQGDGFGKTRL